jgi:hypothetical protein
MPDNRPEAKLTDKKQFDIVAEIDKVRSGVVAGPAPGSDPDSKQRLAKTLAAVDVDLPSGYSVDPVTPKDREAHVAKAEKDRARLVAEAAAARKAAYEAESEEPRSEPPQGRASQQERQHTTAASKPSAKT